MKKYSKAILPLCIITATLAAFGGLTSEQNINAKTDENISPESDQGLTKISVSQTSLNILNANSIYPEPLKNIFNENTIGFYDQNAQGATRSVRNDLTGTFAAMIQFAQNHTVDPAGNELQKMPRLTSEKDALLLVTPSPDMGEIDSLNAEIYFNSRLVRRVTLQEPYEIPASDQTNSDQRAQVQYSKRAWTIPLNWDEVKPGLNIRIVDPNSRKNGRLNANDIEFAPPGELVVQSIRLGMLSNPPVSSGHHFLINPEQAGADYLQTIPASKIIVTKYDDMTLNKVMVGSGVIYDTVSSTTGDVYSGDMRENTAKSTFSVGINLANWGITSSGMVSQQQPQLTQSVVIHHARGHYQNGFVNHGLSGGNSILTLIDSVGNEFSHEIGHHYGLGHYPGEVSGNYFWASHHHDSGWGYMSHRKRMRGNLNWNNTNYDNRLAGTPLFNNQYIFAPDSMSGGAFSSSLSRYTHYTGYSTSLRIQPSFNKATWDASSPTGYKQWNSTTRQMEVVQPKVPQNMNTVWFNRPDGNYLKPTQFGVPVFTILGGYDPVNQIGLIYPAARGNWGNVFNLPKADTSLNNQNCWLHVSYANKASENIALAPNRMGSNANKFHVNLAQSDYPQVIDLYCKSAGQQAVKLSEITIPQYASPLPNAVTFGKEHGFKALRDVELPILDDALKTSALKTISSLSSTHKILFDAYRDYKHELSVQAAAELERYQAQEELLYRINRWINVYRRDLLTTPVAATALKQFVGSLGLNNDNPMHGASMFVMPNMNNACLKAEISSTNNKPSVFMSGRNGCDGSDETLWIYDAIGKIHSVKYPDYCIAGAGLAKCNNLMSNQMWTTVPSSNNQINFKQNSICLDLSSGRSPAVDGRGVLTTYSCTNGNNQRWTMMDQSDNLLLAGINGDNLKVLVSALSQ